MIIGIDIGTTSISFNVVEKDSNKIVKSLTVPNSTSFIKLERKYEDLQDPEKIYRIVNETISEFIMEFDKIDCIGIAGAMHGVVYVDENGLAVSPLYTWRDGSGNQFYPESGNTTYAMKLAELSGCNVSSGCGLLTYFCHYIKKEIPETAVTFCSISDYIAMRLANIKFPKIHISNAASFGIFDVERNDFKKDIIKKVGLNKLDLPTVTEGYDVLGYYLGKIPVCVAIGDNQASYISSVNDMENGLLVNVGTGSQITFATDTIQNVPSMELRPCFKGKYLQVGSSLCGGQALSLLETFYRKTAELVICSSVKSGYTGIDKCLDNMYQNRTEYASLPDSLQIYTKFCGTRVNPQERGCISNINMDNFTPENILLGFMQGVASELYDMYKNYETFNSGGKKHTCLMGSGNAIRKNKYFQYIISEIFGMEIKIPLHQEETAYGATLFALVCNGTYASISDAQSRILYNV